MKNLMKITKIQLFELLNAAVEKSIIYFVSSCIVNIAIRYNSLTVPITETKNSSLKF